MHIKEHKEKKDTKRILSNHAITKLLIKNLNSDKIRSCDINKLHEGNRINGKQN